MWMKKAWEKEGTKRRWKNIRKTKVKVGRRLEGRGGGEGWCGGEKDDISQHFWPKC